MAAAVGCDTPKDLLRGWRVGKRSDGHRPIHDSYVDAPPGVFLFRPRASLGSFASGTPERLSSSASVLAVWRGDAVTKTLRRFQRPISSIWPLKLLKFCV